MTRFARRPVRGRMPLAAAVTVAGALMLPAQAAAQDPPAQGAQQQAQSQEAQREQPAQQNAFMFGGDAGLLVFLVKPDKIAEFETVVGKLHEALANSEKPERRQQAESWKVYKAAEPGPNGAVVYYNLMTPVLKGADYTPSKIVYEVFPSEAQELFRMLRESLAGVVRNELTLLRDFSTPAPRTPPIEAPAPETTAPAEGAAPQP